MPIIRRVAVERLDIPLRHHFATARDSLPRQVSTPVAIHLEMDDGRTSTGEAVPVFYVTGETADTVCERIDASAASLVGADITRLRPILRSLDESFQDAPTARAGVEMALYRAHAAALGVSLWRVFGGAISRVETDITLPIVPDVLERAREAAARGFRIFKMKVGSAVIEEDFARLVTLHEALPGARFRIDANQAFEPEGALRFIERASAHGVKIELVEQPTPKEDLAALDVVARKSPVPVFADEAVCSPTDAIRVIRETAAHGINVKVMKAGLAGALDIVAIARAAGRQLMIGCMLESRRGIAASLALACGTGAFQYVDLDSHLLLSEPGPNTWFDEEGPTLSVIEPER